MDEYSRLQTLYEIADGATGLGPWLAGRARDEINRMGYEYPAKNDDCPHGMSSRSRCSTCNGY